jgi:hypothetical protein
MFYPEPADYCGLAPADKPRLVVVVDTEEEFDWSEPFSRERISVKAMRRIESIQRIFDRYLIAPVYVIDYPVVSQIDGYKPLLEIHSAGRCSVGAHLHPWVNPPFEEEVTRYNSFPGNLPQALEEKKLRILSERIGERFGESPVVYKAGRYGIGANTEAILQQQGYDVDLSVCPRMNYSAEGGPDFSRYNDAPFWFGKEKQILELPLTVGFVGHLRAWGRHLHKLATGSVLEPFRVNGLLTRLNLVNKVWLSPEGYSLSEQIKLVRALYHQGLRIFSFAFHSPSLDPGHTPYVSSETELSKFLDCCRGFFDFFLGGLGGLPSSPLALRDDLNRRRQQTAPEFSS